MMTPKETVMEFWNAMQSNDFMTAAQWLSEDFQGYWPQTSELTVGRSNFIALNSYYPANGQWHFEINSIVCEGETVVTDVSITDGVQNARAITFHTVESELICKQIEYWPENYAPPQWRSKWVKVVAAKPEVNL